MNEDADIRNRIQSLRIHILSMTEFFTMIDTTVKNTSPKIYNFESMGAFDELDDMKAEVGKYQELLKEAQAKVQILMGAMSELSVSLQDLFFNFCCFSFPLQISTSRYSMIHLLFDLLTISNVLLLSV